MNREELRRRQEVLESRLQTERDDHRIDEILAELRYIEQALLISLRGGRA